jgi:Rrf2 family transcriptional repressor of oqxAB
MLDYRFPTALQMVLSVAMAEQLGKRSTSAILAYGLEANPSFIRKLMVPLTRDGIIVSTLGRTGSIHLGRPAAEITLRDIYTSVIEDKKLWASRPDVAPRCLVSANLCWYFKSIAEQAEEASLKVLETRTVADALNELKKHDTSNCEPLPDLEIAELCKKDPSPRVAVADAHLSIPLLHAQSTPVNPVKSGCCALAQMRTVAV